MTTDRTELEDLATQRPALRDLLASQWEAWAEASFVDSWSGPPRTDWGEEPNDRIIQREPNEP